MTLALDFINSEDKETRFAKKVELNNFIVGVRVILTDTSVESLKKRSIIDSINNYNGTETNKTLLMKDFEGFQYLIID